MGVGKTIQSLALAYLYRKDWPLLIICPSSLKLTWKDEILKWLDHLQAEDIQVFNKGMEKFEEDKLIYILSYTLATRLVGVIENRNFGVVVLDEAHYLKARDSKRSRALVPVVMKAKRVM
jgi:SWI/SNF-related matrix-associated actin-dependent regulator of chromatin subfamily A-like protein 1